MRTTVLVLILTCTLVACSDRNEAATGAAKEDAPAVAAHQELTPEQLGTIGAQIAKNSTQATQILSQHGLDPKTFEAKIRKITEDPEASRRYAAAYEKAKA